jgi:hypothetical protein
LKGISEFPLRLPIIPIYLHYRYHLLNKSVLVMSSSHISIILSALTENNDHNTSYIAATQYLIERACTDIKTQLENVLTGLYRIKGYIEQYQSLDGIQAAKQYDLYQQMCALGREVLGQCDFQQQIYINL